MFEIIGINVLGVLKVVVMVIGFENFLFLVNEIETKFFVLLGSEIIGEIFFDFLCVNGLEWNCFVMLEMKYGWIMLDTVKIIDE